MKLILISLSFVLAFSCSSINSVKKSVEKSTKKITTKLEKPIRAVNPFYVAWNKNLDPLYNSGNLPIGTGSPFIYEDHLYIGDLSGNMHAYDLETGVTAWEFEESEAINTMATNFKDNIIYGTMSGRMFSRHYLTGKLNYAIDLGAPIESEPVVYNGRLYIHLRNHKIVSLDAQTGKIIWGYKRSVPFTTTLNRASKVLPFGSKLIVGFADGNVVALSIAEGVVLWEQKISEGLKFVDVDAPVMYFNKELVAGSANGTLKFLNPKNGIINKSVNIKVGHTPLVVGDELIVGSVYGTLYRVSKHGKILQKKDLSKNGISSVVKWKNGFAVATMGQELHYIDSMDFGVNATFKLGYDQSAVFGFLQENKDYLATYSARNRLYVFKNIK